MNTQNIEKLFKDKFSSFEADVNPNAWTNIVQGLQPTLPAEHASGAKATGMLGKMGVSSIILFLAISVTLIGTTIYLVTDEAGSEIASVKDTPQALKENTTTAIPSMETVVLNHVNPAVLKNISSEKQIVSNASEPSPVKAVIPVIGDSEKSKENNSATSHEEFALKSSSPDLHSSNNNSTVMNQPADNNTVADFREEISLGEPAYSDIISTPEADGTDLKFFVPNAFSPNGDLVNEDFTPMGLNIKEYVLTIFDRSGHEIFTSNDIENKWNGKLRDGSPAPADVYVYLINVKDMNNTVHPYSGSITLKR